MIWFRASETGIAKSASLSLSAWLSFTPRPRLAWASKPDPHPASWKWLRFCADRPLDEPGTDSSITVYILEGPFTLELEGRPPVVLKAGDSYVEPPNVKMTGYNKSTTEPMRVVIFYVGEPNTPFLDVAH
jgi:Cupin domain